MYDPVRDRLLVVMGFTASGGTNEVWELSLAGTPTWSLLGPGGGAPGSRASHTVIYDPPRDRLVMFGGFLSTGLYTTEEWELSLSGTPTWTLLSPVGAPPPARAAHVAVYDPVGDRMLVHSGRRSGSGTAVYWDDLWQHPLSEPPSWSLVIPGGVSIELREAPVVVKDPSRDRAILFGGCAPSYTGTDMSCVALGDVLAFDLGANAWTRLLPAGTAPPPGSAEGVYDLPRDRMLVWRGGSTIWELSFSGTPTWSALSTSGTAPPWRQTVHDPLRERMLVFDADASGMLVRSLSLATLTWSDLSPVGTTPSFRDLCGIVYDAGQDQVLLFGGTAGGGFSNEVVVLSLAGTPAWVTMNPAGTPPAGRWFPFVVHDTARERLVLFSGRTQNATSAGYPTDTWALTWAGGPTWQALTPTGGPPRGREHGAALYDEARDRMLIWVGMRNHPLESIIPINESWELSWNNVVAVASPGSPATLSLGIPYPNPGRRDANVRLDLARPSAVEWRVHDLAGRRIVRRRLGTIAAGNHRLEWNLRDAAGRPVPPGVYVFEVASDGGAAARRRIAVLR